jgi:nicotinate-nucleotide adenylyltransferase
MKRIGLFGGSFNPVHLGHLLVASAAREELNLDRIFFVPAAQSPFKPDQQLAPAEKRLQMLRLALAGCSWSEVDEQEIKRGGLSYSIDTVKDYAARHPGAKLFYLIGADHVQLLPKWRCADELARLTSFVVVSRPGETPPPAMPPFNLHLLSGFPLGLSASQIRERVREGLPLEFLAPGPVLEVIEESRIYIERGTEGGKKS